jgi:hypothetical protein
VLGDVGDRLGRDVITGRLDVLTKPRAEIKVEFDRHRRTPGQCLESRAEPGLGQDGRVDAVRDLPQFIQDGTQTLSQHRQLTPDRVRGPGCHRPDGAGLQRQRDQTLLDTVVQVTLDTPPRLVRGGDDPGPRSGQLGAALSVRDGGSQQLSEFGQTILRAIGDRPVRGRDRHQPPDSSVHDDRRAGDAIEPELTRLDGKGATSA